MKATTYNTNPLNKATMKNFYFRKYITLISILLASVFGAININATTYYWVGGAGSLNWHTATTAWSTVGVGGAATGATTTPTAADVFIFDGSDISSTAGLQTGTVTVAPNAAITLGQLILQNGATVIYANSSGGRQITVSGSIGGTDLVINSGCSLTIQGSTTANSLATGTTGNIAGSLILGVGSNSHSLAVVDVGALIVASGGSITYNTNVNPFGTAATVGTVVFQSGSTLTNTKGLDPFGGAGKSVVTFQDGSTYIYNNSTAAQFLLNGNTFANLTLGAAATPPAGASGFTIKGNLAVNTGAFTIAATGTSNYFKGNITVGSTLTIAPGSAATYEFNGTSAQTITNTGTFTAPNANSTIKINNANGVTLASPISLLGVLNLTLGNLNTTSTNLLSITNTTTSGISGGSSSSYINGPIKWSLPTGLAGGSTYNFPIGAGASYLPISLKPTTAGATSAQVQAFASACGGTGDGSTVAALSSTEYWSITGIANFTSTTVDITRASAISPFDRIGYSSTAGGTYATAAGTAGTYSITNSNSIAIGAASKYLTFASLSAGTPPTVTTQAVSSIAATTATGNFNITALGDGVTSSGVCWKTSTGPTTSDSKTTDGGTTTGAKTGSITGLTANTTYYVKGYATGSGGTGYGSEETFATLPAAPTATAASSLAGTSFSANWTAPTQGAVAFTYEIQVDEDGGDWSSLVASQSAISSATLTYSATGLSNSTAYQYRVRATNATGSGAWSNTITATTTSGAAAPTVTSTSASSITTTTASAGGNVTSDGGSAITARGTAYGTSANPTTGTTDAGTTGAYTSSITGLTANTVYYYRAKAVNAIGTSYGSETTFTTLSLAPTVGAGSGATSTGISANWTAPAAQGGATYTYTVEIDNNSDFSSITATQTGIASGTLTYAFTGLSNSTTYYYRVKAVNAGGSSAWSSTSAGYATTAAGPTCVQISSGGTVNNYNFGDYTMYFSSTSTSYTAASVASSGSNLCNGATARFFTTSVVVYLQAAGASEITFQGQQGYNLTIASVYTADALAGSYSALGSYTPVAYTGTACGTLGITGVSIPQGKYVLITFTGTAPHEFRISGLCVSPILLSPTVSTQAVTGQTTTAGDANGTITNIGNSAVTTSGFCWNTAGNPTTADTKSTDGPTTATTFTKNISALTANTNYYVKAYATNTDGTGYGSQVTLLTLPGQASVAGESSVTSTGFTANWTAPVGQGAATFTYTVEVDNNSDFSSLTTSQTGIASGTTSYAFTGLSNTTTYYYRVKAVNATGSGAYSASYETVTTSGPAPTVTSTSASAIATTTTSAGGNVTSDGGSAVTARGTAYGTSANPTTGTSDGGTTGAYASSITGLTANTVYYYRAYATNANGTGYGSETTFTTLSLAPTVGAGSGATSTGISANWTAPAAQGGATYTYTVEIDNNNDFSSVTATQTGIASGTLTYAFTGLSSATTYYYRVKAVNAGGSSAWSATSVGYATTAAANPYSCENFDDAAWTTVTTGSGYTGSIVAPTGTWTVNNSKRLSTGAYSAANCMNPSSSGSYFQSPTLSNGVGTITFYGIYNAKTIIVQIYNASNTLLQSQTFTMTGSWAQYTYSVSEATATYVRFFRGSDNNVKFDDVCITAYGVAPTVTTQATSVITSTTATGNGTITNIGDGVTSSGVVWNTATAPTTALSTKTTDGPTTATTLTGSITSLTANTLYYVRAYATGSGGTGYGNEVTFTTLPTAPTVAASSSVTSNSFVANWTAPTQGSATFTYTLEVDEAIGDWSTLVGAGNPYTAIASGTISQAVTGLSSSTAYKYRVKCVNATGESSYSADGSATTTAPAAEIDVLQAGTSYTDGSGTYAFGLVTNASNSDITFTVQNTGAGTLTISSASVSGTGFTLQSAPGGTVAAGGSTTLVVRFSPVSSIAYTGTLTVNSDDSDEAVYTVALTGTGTSNLAPPTGLVSSSVTASGFTLGYNTVGAAANGYEAKVCQVDLTPTNILELTNAEITAWTPFPAAITCTNITDFVINYNTSTTVAATEGTITLNNVAIGGNASCNYIVLGKPNQAATVSHTPPTANYWEGGNTDITGDGVMDGGMIILPELSSAGTVTVNVKSYSGTGALLIEKSIDGGTTFSAVGSAALVTTTAINVTATVNELNPVIIRIRNVANGTNYKWLNVNSFSVTNYAECGADNVIASQATASYNFTGLNPNTIYYYSIRSKNGGTYSRWSTINTATTNEVTLPNPPTSSSTSAITTSGYTITWVAPAVVGDQTYTYTVEYGTTLAYGTSLPGIPSATLTQALTGLNPNTLYYYRIRCENASGASTWITGSATTLGSTPTVTTTAVSAVATTTATSGGDVTATGGNAITDMGLAYATTAAPTTGVDEPSNALGAYTSSLTGLTPNTVYYYRAYATNSQGTGYGAESNFTTLPLAPTMTAGSAASATGFTANWTAPATPGTATYTYTVEVTTASGDYTSPVATASGIASGTISKVFNTLNSTTEYFYRVKAVNATGSGAWSTESAGITSDAGAPNVTTAAISAIAATSATAGGEVVATGGTAVSVRGTCFSTTTGPTTANSPTSDGSGLGIFASSLTSLTPNTKYYFRAYATNTGYTGYGAEADFTTLPNAPVATAATTVLGSSFTATWTAPVIAGTATYTYDIEVSATSGNYASTVASATGLTSATLTRAITGLTASTNYYYHVRAVNESGAGAWSNEITTTTTAEKTLTVTFTNGTVTANGTPMTSGVAMSFSANSDVTLQATPNATYGFLRWTFNGTDQQTDNPYTITLSDNTTATATFGGASCTTYNFDDVTTTDLSTSDVTDGFTTSSTAWSTITSRLNTTAGNSHSGNNSIKLSYSNGAVISLAVSRPVSISFWSNRFSTSATQYTKIKVYMSTDGGANYDPTPILSDTVQPGSVWQQFSAAVSTTATNVKFKIINESSVAGGTSYSTYVDDVQICTGPDAAPPVITIVPANAATGVLTDANMVLTSDEKLYRYVPGTGARIEITVGDAAFSNADTLATFLTLIKVSDNSAVPFTANIDATGKIITVNPTAADLAYNTQYRVSLRNVADVSGNVMATTQSSTFTTRATPAPLIVVQDAVTGDVINNGDTYNFGTLIGGATITKSFKVYNLGTDPLTITSSNITGVKYTKTASPTGPVAVSAFTTLTVVFTPGGTPGVYTGDVTIINNTAGADGTFVLNMSGSKAQFVLPYTFESGCTTPVISATEFKHDYTTLTDIPAEISLNNGIDFNDDHFFVDYSVFHVEGSCMPNGSTALRVGEGNNSLEIAAPAAQGCGKVTVKWCANGYRKVRITDELGNVYIQSPTYQIGENCYTTTAVVNRSGAVTVDVEFLGTDPALLTTVYFLEVTPYDPALKSSAKNIIDISTNIATENVRIYDDVVFISVPAAGNPLNAITTDLLKVSPFATVSPGLGTQNYSAGPVNYTVTAEDGSTKVYKVYVEHTPSYTGFYQDTVEWSTLMNDQDQILEVIEISNAACTVPVSGNGSAYTIHFLSVADNPGTYNIGGLGQVCIGATSVYSITNAPASNNPSYTWAISGAGASDFTVVGGLNNETLTLKAPDVITNASLALDIAVIFSGGCIHVDGTASKPITVTENAPDPITGLQASCVENGQLVVTAVGSEAATTYNWNFTPSTTQVIVQNDSTITLNIGTGSSDIAAAVTTQNGCGVTVNPVAYGIDYGTPETEWTGLAGTGVWTNNANWTARAPKPCTNVIIPNVNVGSVPYPTISATDTCHYITFEPGGAVLGIEKLEYTKAFVQLELSRDKWYTLTSPLKEMYSGDYFFSGAPLTSMRLFDAINPDSLTRGGTITEGTFTKTFAANNVALTAGMGFAYNVGQKTWDYPNGSTNIATPLEFTLPRMNVDSTLFENYIPFSALNGKPNIYKITTVAKDENLANRFAIENGAGNIPATYSIAIPTGKSLIGNPVMTHLNINSFLTRNATVLNPDNIRLWTGTSYISYSGGTWSGGGYTGNFIAPMQSFIVESSTGGNIDFAIPADFGADDNASALRLCAVNENMLHIESQNSVASSYATVTLNDKAKNEFDAEDVDKLFTPLYEVADVYTLSSSTALDFNRFNKYPYTTPLGIRSSNYGKTNLKFRGANTFADAEVYLVNTATNEKVNLKEQGNYEFDLTPENGEGTLFLEFRSASTTTDDKTANDGDIQIFTKEGNIIRVISNPQDLIQEVVVMDETGRVILINKNLNIALHDTTLNNGYKVVLVKVTTQNGVKTAKVLIK